MNQPTPAIVAQDAVRRLPRLALFLLCLAYIVPGFVGRQPWKSADMTSFGYMANIASGLTGWLTPEVAGQGPAHDALLPYWLGALFMQGLPWLDPALASRLPFVLLLALTLTATWYGVYHLARSPQAQPVAFAFGGEAHPADYARAMADGGLLALIACLGLAQLSHETTPALTQLASVALVFYSVAALPVRQAGPVVGLHLGLAGLALSGAPTLAALLGTGCLVLCASSPHSADQDDRRRHSVLVLASATLLSAALATAFDLWRWRIALPGLSLDHWPEWRSLGRLLLWFTWPAWPLALWTLWRWRYMLRSRHVALPLWFAALGITVTLTTPSADRSLLLALPALATLAAFSLPTLRRSMSALIDWFTLLFFTASAITIWVVWIAMQTGFPAKPAANVAKLAPDFVPSFSWLAFVVALLATLAWAWLVTWRVGRHRTALWKSLVLPAGGAVLGWLLLMTLWLPALDFARSYTVLAQRVAVHVRADQCVEMYGLSQGHAAALKYHGGLTMLPVSSAHTCPWLLVDTADQATLPEATDMVQWNLQAVLRRPSDRTDDVLLYRRLAP